LTALILPALTGSYKKHYSKKANTRSMADGRGSLAKEERFMRKVPA
jgi:hypothetical protein